MVDVVLTRQAIEPGKTDRLREWTAEIRRREDEAVATLRNEGMYTESAFVEHTDDGDFLVYYMEAEDIDRVVEAFEASTHEIDREHEAMLEDVLVGFEDVGDYELLYHMTNPDRP